ncbi:MAG: ADP-ribosylation factor-like protein, partial [Candidatus Hermodarchaeota archaeon]
NYKMTENNVNIIRAIVLSIFDEDGPTPKIFWPNDLEETASFLIATKTLSLLMGDAIYQDGDSIEGINYFGVLPFPDLNLKALTYFFLIADVNARGNAKAATITILVKEDDRAFIYENMKYLRVIMDKTATDIQEAEEEDLNKIIDRFKEELLEFCKELKEPFDSKRKIKIVYAGLDQAGKTSFLLAIKKKYSEIIKTLPTKGVARSEEKIFKEQNSHITVWDLGGQKTYREKYIEQSKYYLYNIDLLFYFIDIQDTGRLNDSIELFIKIINSLDELDEYPPIIVCINKFDPDLKNSKKTKKNYKDITNQIKKHSGKFFIKIFQTSIFDQWSMISAYSFGLSQLSPNRELFRQILKQFAENTNAETLLLLNDKGIILSNYSKNKSSSKVFEISAIHFQSLYKTFKEFKLLKKNYIISSGISEDSKNIIFGKVKLDKYDLYLLLFMEEYHSIEKIEQYLPDFSRTLNEIISTYI